MVTRRTALLVNEVVSNFETYVWRVDVKTGDKKAITPRDGEKAAFANIRYSPDGRKVYTLSDRAGGEWRIWRCDIANCAWTAVTPAGLAVEGANVGGAFELSPDGAQLAVNVDRGSSDELQIVDLSTLKARAVPDPSDHPIRCVPIPRGRLQPDR